VFFLSFVDVQLTCDFRINPKSLNLKKIKKTTKALTTIKKSFIVHDVNESIG